MRKGTTPALLLGLLCTPNLAESQPAALSAFYSVLLPCALSSETPWALLNAMLPVATPAHASLLKASLEPLSPDDMTSECKQAHTAFGQRLLAQAGGAAA